MCFICPYRKSIYALKLNKVLTLNSAVNLGAVIIFQFCLYSVPCFVLLCQGHSGSGAYTRNTRHRAGEFILNEMPFYMSTHSHIHTLTPTMCGQQIHLPAWFMLVGGNQRTRKKINEHTGKTCMCCEVTMTKFQH